MSEEGAVTTEAPVEAPIATDNVSSTTTIPTLPTPLTTAPLLSEIIPAEFKETAWVKDLKDVEGLFKMTGDLKTKLGERPAGIPHENSSPEEKAAFNKLMGVPENSGEYKLSEPVKGHEDFQNKVKEILFKHNLSQDQAGGLEADWNELMAQMQPNPEAQDTEFDTMATSLFGDKKEGVLKNANALLADNAKDLPAEFKDAFNNLPNKILIPLAAVLDNIQKKFINEDDLPGGGNAVNNTVSHEALRAEAIQIRSSEAWKSTFHAGHAAAVARSNEIYKIIAP